MTGPRLGRGRPLTRSAAIAAAAVLAVGAGFAAYSYLRPTSAPHGYTRGDALRYLPGSCPAYRVYVDVPGLWSAVGSRDLLEAARRAKPTAELLQAFDEAGIDPARDLQDIAFCGLALGKNDEERGRLYVAIGGALGGERALERYKSVVLRLAHVGPTHIVEEKAGKVPYLVSDLRRKHVWIAMPAPDVLVFSTEDVAEVGDLKGHGVEGEAWQLGPGTLAGFEVGEPGARGPVHVTGRIVVQGPNVGIEATVHHGALASLDAAKLDTIRAASAQALERAGLGELSDPVRTMALSLTDGELHARLEAPGQSWGRALEQVDEKPSLIGAVLTELTRRPGE